MAFNFLMYFLYWAAFIFNSLIIISRPSEAGFILESKRGVSSFDWRKVDSEPTLT